MCNTVGQNGCRVAIGTVKFDQVALDALLKLLHPRLQLPVGKVLVSVVDRLELAAVDGHDAVSEQLQPAAQQHELAAHLADRIAVVLAEVSNSLEVWRQPPGKPHQLDVALRLVF